MAYQPPQTNNVKPVMAALTRMSPTKVTSTLPMRGGNVRNSSADRDAQSPVSKLLGAFKSGGYNPWSLRGTLGKK